MEYVHAVHLYRSHSSISYHIQLRVDMKILLLTATTFQKQQTIDSYPVHLKLLKIDPLFTKIWPIHRERESKSITLSLVFQIPRHTLYQRNISFYYYLALALAKYSVSLPTEQTCGTKKDNSPPHKRFTEYRKGQWIKICRKYWDNGEREKGI